MDETELRLDGNAMAGVLAELFGGDLTAANGRCAGCGREAQLGGQLLYRYPHAPGAVLRCAACHNVLLVIVRVRGGWRLTLRGLSWLDIEVVGAE